MEKPIIFAIDDDSLVLKAVTRALKSQYREDYRILSSDNPEESLELLEEIKKKGRTVALFVADQRMPSMLGVDFLKLANPLFPEAKKVLLTAYSDTDAAIRAINEINLDYYLTKPWTPAEEKLYPILDDLLNAWQLTYVPEFQGLRVIGYQYSPKSHEIKDFLSSNLFPYEWLDYETSEKAKEILKLHDADPKQLPIVSFPEGECLPNPSIMELADRLSFNVEAKEEMYDVAIIGAGPSGLAAAVYGGSEGLNTILIEKKAPGGQAGSSSRIENYLGFPSGLSGQELTHRAITQAKRFGIEFLSPKMVTSIEIKDNYKILTLNDGKRVNAKSLIIATGVSYRKLDAKGVSDFTGAGIYYGSSMAEAQSCKNQDVYIVGGGNSAGQAAVYLSRYAKNVNIVIRREDLTSTMSSYLIDQLDQIPNISVVNHTNVIEAKGDDRLESLVLKKTTDDSEKEVQASAFFIFIGSKPVTDWIELDIFRNKKGFIETGKSLMNYQDFNKIWKLEREPYFLESCIPGVFVAGDVRAGAMNRVASAVGEGSMAISFVHQYLAEN